MYCKLNVIAKDKKTGITEVYTFSQTKHCMTRASQRAITNDKLKLVLTFGEPYYKQGLIYYVLGESSIPKEYKKDCSKLINTVAIVDGSSDTIITCYRSKNAHKHIKNKQKRNSITLAAA
jgi:hypothetical protein